MRFTLTAALAATLLAAPAAAQDQSIAQEVIDGCRAELDTHCAEVTPGEGRLLACLYSYNDKLSGQCEFALYDAAVRLERAISVITYLASECRSDIESLCAGVEAGEGRIAQCLADNQDQLSEQCTRAIDDVSAE